MGDVELKKIGVVTVGRSDYSIYYPLLRKLKDEPGLSMSLFVSGMHLSHEFGTTANRIEDDGFTIDHRITMLVSSDSAEGVGKSMGLGVTGFAQAFTEHRPDILIVLGDRFEMHAAALAALPFRIPVAHIHGGELTQGAIDDALRHSITKLSHLHFVSTEAYARRVRQLGEEPWRVIVSGALGIDNVLSTRIMELDELNRLHGIDLTQPYLLVTFHPVSLHYGKTNWHVKELLAALDAIGMPVLLTMPNADVRGRMILDKLNDYVASRPFAQIVDNLGTEGYLCAMANAAAMVGNSSSGIVEAAPFKLPVVNIGDRQQGRVRSANIIDVSYSGKEIVRGIRKALSDGFRLEIRDVVSPYGNGHAAEKIVDALATTEIGDRLLIKRFVDYPGI